MDTTSHSQVSVKLFVGCLITSEIRMHLKKSHAWKEATIESRALAETTFHKKKYLGRFLSQEPVSLHDLRIFVQDMKQILHAYCHELPMDTFTFFTFSQVFIT